jgi:hypothetical protein
LDAIVTDARGDAVDAAPCGASGQACCTTQACNAPLACKSSVCTPLASGTETAVLYTGSETWVFDGTEWTMMMVANPTPPRLLAVMGAINGEVVLFGGLWSPSDESMSPDLNDTWAWNGTVWTQLQPALSPPPRDSAMMAPLGHSLVLFGGEYSPVTACDVGASCGTPSVYGDTWAFDGMSWSQASSVGPGSEGGELGPFGDELILLDEGAMYAWNGSSWTALSGSTPSPLLGAAVEAPLGDGLVLFGGVEQASECTALAQTWLFQSGSWMALDAGGPPARTESAITPLNGELLMYGGLGGTMCLTGLGDTWTWNGSVWTQLDVQGPGGTYQASMATLTLP